ncbi:hypothetical protein [Streptomyces sp. NPDC001889]
MTSTQRVFAFRVPATAIVHVRHTSETAAAAVLADALNADIELADGTTYQGVRLSTLALDEAGELDQIDGIPLDDRCSNEDCRDELDGDSWDGDCASCADRTYSADVAAGREYA